MAKKIKKIKESTKRIATAEKGITVKELEQGQQTLF